MQTIKFTVDDAHYQEAKDLIAVVIGSSSPGYQVEDLAKVALDDWVGVLRRKAMQRSKRLEMEAAAAEEFAGNIVQFPRARRSRKEACR